MGPQYRFWDGASVFVQISLSLFCAHSRFPFSVCVHSYTYTLPLTVWRSFIATWRQEISWCDQRFLVHLCWRKIVCHRFIFGSLLSLSPFCRFLLSVSVSLSFLLLQLKRNTALVADFGMARVKEASQQTGNTAQAIGTHTSPRTPSRSYKP